MVHALTIDVEDGWSLVARDWLGQPQERATDAVVRNTRHVLGLLGSAGAKATFFLLGEVAECFPDLVREVASGGHEIGVHGYYHHQFFKLTPEQARREVGDAKRRIEDILGRAVEGHRAPAFSIRPDTAWALELLVELGFRYDSSVYPIRGKRYGWPDFPLDIHEMTLPSGAKLVEAPPSVVTLLGKRLPACGGGYVRHFPYWYTRWAVRRIGRRRPAVVYMHPYDLDLAAAPVSFEKFLSAADRPTRRFLRMQRRNRCTMEPKLRRLLGEFRFAPLGEVIRRELARPVPA